ncbi:hypothetical protein [Pseudacidobacterium ailaaui]|uniref:hypothetical protein n=1 Tax=Pseudacidobacterium ailaaui TaxID=1382359 RepID=UPI00047B1E48|nr:hypothetical protein [Pseudacidobacterium ailaaui]
MKLLVTEFSLFLIFFGLHTTIALAPGGKLLVPFVLCIVGAVGILIANAHSISFTTITTYGWLGVVLLVMAIITSFADHDLPQHILSSGLFLYSMVIAFATFVGVSRMGLKRTSRFFLLMACILILGATLEVHAGLKPVSDAFRQAVNGWQSENLYNYATRDITEYGGIRPCFLATEPSILGISTGYGILFWFLSGRKYRAWRFGAAMLLAAAGFVVVRSPTILVCLFVAFLFFVLELPIQELVPKARMIGLSISALLAILIVPGIIAATTTYGKTSSFFQRELAPPLIAAQALRHQPLFGTGFGGSGMLIQYGLDVASGSVEAERDMINIALSERSVAKKLIASQFWEIWIDLGLLGSILVLYFIWKLLGQLSVPNRFFVLSACALVLTMSGGVVNPGGWVGIFTAAALYKQYKQVRRAAKLPEAHEIVHARINAADTSAA